MAASVQITIRDNTSDAAGLISDLRSSYANGKSAALHLGNYLKQLSVSGTAAGYIAVSSTAPIRAVGTATFANSGPSNNQTMGLGANLITYVTSGATGNQVNLSAGVIATQCTDTAALINTSSTFKTMFSATATATTVVVTCKIGGLIGRQVRFGAVGTLTDVSFDGSGCLGGTTAGAGCDDSSILQFCVNGGTTF